MATSGKGVDPRTPVIVGVGQLSQRTDEGEPALEPVDLMVEALRRAQADSGRDRLLAAADSIRVVNLLSWRYRDPAALVAERLGVSPRQTVYTTPGGQTPQMLLNATALDIAAGRADVVLVAGAEAWRTRMAVKRLDQRPDWTRQPDGVEPTMVLGHELAMNHPAEMARGVVMPVQLYPLFENALRAEAGRGLDEHQVVISELWARFSAVAATNPAAWTRRAYTAEEIRSVSPDNRMIGFPYPKLMNSNNMVDQGAALVLCSLERARAFGVAEDRWVFPLAGSDASDTPFLSHRADLTSSPAIRVAGRAALELAGVGIDDVAHVDLYSCFPSAVQISARELGLGLDRPLTVTGGLTFAGGPWNDYVTHAVAAMVEVLRSDPGSVGLCSANGGFVTKHSFGLYSTDPPAGGFGHAAPQAELDALPRRELAEEHDGPVTVESYTVMHDRDGEPENAIAACLLPDGRRAWGTSQDPDVMKAMTVEEICGRPATLRPDGQLHVG